MGTSVERKLVRLDRIPLHRRTRQGWGYTGARDKRVGLQPSSKDMYKDTHAIIGIFTFSDYRPYAYNVTDRAVYLAALVTEQRYYKQSRKCALV